jgi:hypothetical protein
MARRTPGEIGDAVVQGGALDLGKLAEITDRREVGRVEQEGEIPADRFAQLRE